MRVNRSSSDLRLATRIVSDSNIIWFSALLQRRPPQLLRERLAEFQFICDLVDKVGLVHEIHIQISIALESGETKAKRGAPEE